MELTRRVKTLFKQSTKLKTSEESISVVVFYFTFYIRRKRKMGTHGSFGILLEQENDIIYVTSSSNGQVDNMGEFLLSVLRTEGVEGLLVAMRDNDLERIDHEDEQLFSVSSMELFQEWTFSEWTYLYRQMLDSLLVCYPGKVGESEGGLDIIGQNPYAKYPYELTALLEVPVRGTETVMDVWNRTRSLKREGRYLTLYK